MMIKVLFLTAWYPNRYDAMFGLFVRKHAEAVSRFVEVNVLYVHADKEIKKTEVVKGKMGRVAETIVYYPEKKGGFLRKMLKGIRYFEAIYVGLKSIQKESGMPDLVHVNVLSRTAIPAWLMKKMHRIPYVITEHWTRYLPMTDAFHGFFRKKLTQLMIKEASALMPVSMQLKNAMIHTHQLHHANYQIVNNVVDDFFYDDNQRLERSTSKKRILHVSCFWEIAKNVKGLLRATKQLSLKRQDFEMIIVGSGIDFVETLAYARSLHFPDGVVQFVGEKPPQEVASWFSNSDFFVLFSNYETAGIVISESLANGKPIVSSNVGIAKDYINEDSGIVIDVGNEEAFTNAMDLMLDNYQKYPSDKIKEIGKAFSYEEVGKKIFSIYLNALNKN